MNSIIRILVIENEWLVRRKPAKIEVYEAGEFSEATFPVDGFAGSVVLSLCLLKGSAEDGCYLYEGLDFARVLRKIRYSSSWR
jgi:hypothetical protein